MELDMKLATITDLENNLDKYIQMAKDEEIIITEDGQPFVKLSSAINSKADIVKGLAGIIKLDKSYEELMEERYSKKYNHN